MRYISTNLNYNIKVKLTNQGKQTYHLYHYDDKDPPTLSVDDEGYSTFQIHEFMSIFGTQFHMGNNNLPCETDIQIQCPEQHRPFNNTDELIEFWNKKQGIIKDTTDCPFIWIKEKETGDKELITGYTNETVLLSGSHIPLSTLFERYVFLDNTPIGIEQ